MQDYQNAGDRSLVAHLTRSGNVLFSTYTMLANDNFRSPLTFECQIPEEVQQLWTYAYAAYSHQLQQVTYFTEAGDHQCTTQERALHRTPSYFALYTASDGFSSAFVGKVAYVYVAFGEGAYMQEKMQM